jgi:hypothetical protein
MMPNNGLENPSLAGEPGRRACPEPSRRELTEGELAEAEPGGHPGGRAVAPSGLVGRSMLIANRGLAELTNAATH